MGNATPTIDLPHGKVRVVKPNTETGEILERVIPAKSLRPKPPKEPVAPQLDERLITMVKRDEVWGATGRSVIAMTSHREALLHYREILLPAYWAHFSNHLRRDEQRRLAREGARAVVRPVEPHWQIGDRMYVAADMEAEVVRLTKTGESFATVFKIYDYREVLLKRGVLGDDIPQTDKHGYAPELTPTEKERARLEGAYTTSPARAIDDAGAVMDEAALRRIHAEQSAANALTQTCGRVEVTKGRLLRRIAEARAKHRTSTVRHLERELGHLEAKHAATA
jgi:hypothetical protein